jgi:cation:H+ antiporter
MCFTFKARQGRINRLEGGGLMLVYVGYTGYLAWTIISVA